MLNNRKFKSPCSHIMREISHLKKTNARPRKNLSLSQYRLHLCVRRQVRLRLRERLTVHTPQRCAREGSGERRKEGLCGFLWIQRAQVNCVSSQMESLTKTGKAYLQPHKAGKVSTFKCCCLRVWMIHSGSCFYCKGSCSKQTLTGV